MSLAAAKSQMLGDQLKGLQVQQAQGELQSNQLATEQAQQIERSWRSIVGMLVRIAGNQPDEPFLPALRC